jgi:Cu(I)/Ag(I) efflux system membrane fusion protein/cobalt-zinc-cadmium efflux system membrane fusion protein
MKSLNMLFALFIVFLFSMVQLQAQSHQHGSHSMKGMTDMKEMNADSSKVENIVRVGTIDLKAIDKNKDGKVFQDPMDWNVISDAPGKCPICKMTLKEVTIKTARQNLLKNKFKVK